MFSFRSILSYFATAFTFSIGGGIGEAALMGALFGGAKAAVTGDDVIKGALFGGATGGAMSGIGAAIGRLSPVAVDATSQAVNTTANNAITNSMESQLTPFIQPTGLNSLANVPLTATEAAPNMGISAFNSNPNATSIMQNLGGQAAPVADTAVPFTQAGFDSSPAAMKALQDNAMQGIAGSGANPFTPNAPFVNLKQMINPEAGGMVDKGLNFAIKNPYTTAGIGGAAYGAMNPVSHMPDTKEEKSKFAGYNRDEFTPYEAQQPNPYPTARYAEGGIAALANGSQGMGNNMGYPQGQQDHTQYATPTQMPTSSSVIDSGYEQNTNPYSGEPVGYAVGGQTYDAANAAAGVNPMIGMQNPAAGLRATSFREGDMGMGYLTGRPQGYQGIGNLLQLIQSRAGITGISPNFQRAEDVVPQVYVPSYAAGGQTKPDDSRIAYMGAPNPWGSNQDSDANTAMLSPHEAAAYRQKRLESLVGYANRAKAPQAQMPFNQMTAVQQAQMAAQGAAQPQAENVQNAAHGGIMGADSSLGGYAAGGNPRLLKGPGDGMSDNIPAVIANKQPARLADGEFVIPADVVSHLGNGSTDAGAQHLHTMMNKVRKARTGNSKQGKQIDPNKFLPA